MNGNLISALFEMDKVSSQSVLELYFYSKILTKNGFTIYHLIRKTRYESQLALAGVFPLCKSIIHIRKLRKLLEIMEQSSKSCTK